MIAVLVIVGAVILALPAESRFPAFAGISVCSLVAGIAGKALERRKATHVLDQALDPAASLPGLSVSIPAWVTRSLALFNRRNRGFVVGLGLIGLGQYALAAKDTVLVSFVFTNAFNSAYHVDVPNLDNTILAVILLVLGAYCVVRAVGVSAESEEPVLDRRTFEAPSLSAIIRSHLVLVVAAAISFVVVIWRLGRSDFNIVFLLNLAFTLFVIVYVAFRYDRCAWISLSPGITRLDLLLMLLLLVAGLVVGAYQLDRVPNMMLGDEGAFLEQAKGILTSDSEPQFFDLGVYSFPQASSIYQAGIMRVFGLSLWSWRFSSVLAAVLAVIPTYLLACDLFNRRVAVLSGLAMVTTPYFIAFERMGYNNAQAIFPVALAVYLLYLAVQRESMFYYVWAGIIGGLGFYTYSAGRLGLVVAVIAVYIVFARLRAARRKAAEEERAAFAPAMRKWRTLAAAFAIATVVTVAPLYVYGNARDPVEMQSKFLESVFPHSVYAESLFPPKRFIGTIRRSTSTIRPCSFGQICTASCW